ncbi:MAG: flagellar hook-length control protein FliK [Candidatus Zixiibacteriota bacterium]|nr:MAG: flagellar hook-length control protein FliK [candidate division Zixibacteria bacterium]
MTQTPLNIFDLLIADVHATGANRTGVAGNIEGEGAGIFDEIIRRYLGDNDGVQVATNGIDGTPLMTAGLLGVASPAEPLAAQVAQDLPALLPQQANCWGDNVRRLVTADTQMVEPEPGKYEILSSRVKEGRIYLELKGREPGAQRLRLNLPVESLQLINGSAARRVGLGVDAYEQKRLQNLIAKLNLKEIDVQTIDYSTAATAEEPIEVALIADGTAGEVILKGKLDRNRMRLFADKPEPALRRRSEISNLTRTQTAETPKPRHRAGGEGSAAPAWDPNLAEIVSGEETPLSGNARADTQMGVRTPLTAKDLFDGWKWQTSKNSQMAPKTQGFFGLDAAAPKGQVNLETGNAPTMRLYLPDNIQTVLRPNGSAVTIRIEPDTLGPARLSLVVSNDRLKARIAVESPAAKAVLESNLNRLVEQLARANIQVDHIEITISGDSARNDHFYFGKQPRWRHRAVSRQISLDGMSADERNTAGILPPAGPPQWVGASGVNLLA